jgi:excisionase family DNA binding protein
MNQVSSAGNAVPANQAQSEPQSLLGEYLNMRQLANELSISFKTLERWRLQRKAPPACRVGGRLLFKRSDVLAWIEAQRESAL